MKYAGIIKNDLTAAPGVCETFFTQGCPHHCAGCHNAETWDFNGGLDCTLDIIDEVIDNLTLNGIHRDLCIMGGEPLCPENQELVKQLVLKVKEKMPDTKIYIWTGYTYEELQHILNSNLNTILKTADVLIDGRYDQTLRDVTLPMRGSSNQRIINLKKN